MSTLLTIDTEDPRDLRALVMLASTPSWQPVGDRGGHAAYRIPSQSGDGFIIATTEGCSCDDSHKGYRCKHRRAVAIFEAMQKAQKEVDAMLARRGRR